jgi:hypothetical protein
MKAALADPASALSVDHRTAEATAPATPVITRRFAADTGPSSIPSTIAIAGWRRS